MFNYPNEKGGLVKFIIIIIVAIIVLSYFGFNLRSVVESPTTQGNLSYVWGGVVYVWSGYLERPASYLWNDIFIDLLWNSFVYNLERIKGGGTTTIEELSPQVNF